MPSDHSVMDGCLFLLQFSQSTKVGKPKLEVQIRRTKRVASSPCITRRKKETLHTRSNAIITLYNNPTSEREFTSLTSFLSSVLKVCGLPPKEHLATRQLMRSDRYLPVLRRAL